MKKVIYAIILCSALSTRAQENVIGDFIVPDPKEKLKMGSANPIDPINQFELDYNLLSPIILANSESQQPNLGLNSNIFKNRFSYILYRNKDILHGFGSNYEVGIFLLYQPFDNLTFSLGASGVKYSINGVSYNDYLFSASMTYRFNNWFKLHLYGQYSMNSQSNALSGGYYLSPKNCYGAVVMIKVADKRKYSIDMNMGIERSYNPLNNKWEMNYRLGPEIRLK